MNKSEFLRILRMQLEGQLNQEMIRGHLQYYDQYIDDEMRAGKSEEQVMEELGSPVFIAKTLSDVAMNTAERTYNGSDYNTDDRFYEEEEEASGIKQKLRSFTLNTGLMRFLIPAAFVLIMFLVLFLVGAVATIAVRFAIPILIVFGIYYMIHSFREH